MKTKSYLGPLLRDSVEDQTIVCQFNVVSRDSEVLPTCDAHNATRKYGLQLITSQLIFVVSPSYLSLTVLYHPFFANAITSLNDRFKPHKICRRVQYYPSRNHSMSSPVSSCFSIVLGAQSILLHSNTEISDLSEEHRIGLAT